MVCAYMAVLMGRLIGTQVQIVIIIIGLASNRNSRKIIWLKLSLTNHNPQVVARYYLESIEQVRGDVVGWLITVKELCCYRLSKSYKSRLRY